MTAYAMRISDWGSDVCSSDLPAPGGFLPGAWLPGGPQVRGQRRARTGGDFGAGAQAGTGTEGGAGRAGLGGVQRDDRQRGRAREELVAAVRPGRAAVAQIGRAHV